MSPYARLYQNPGDQAITWLLVAGWIVVACGLRKRLPESVSWEAYLIADSGMCKERTHFDR